MRPAFLASLAPLASGLLFTFTSSPVPAQTTTWQGPNPGVWNDPANWSAGTVPNSNGTLASIPNASDANLAIGLEGGAFTVNGIEIFNTIVSSSVSLGSPSVEADDLLLSKAASSPTINVASGTLKMNARLGGSQGYIKFGNGTLDFCANPHAQAFSGNVSLIAGTIAFGADQDWGATSNGLLLAGNSTVIAAPVDPAVPVTLGAGRSIQSPLASYVLTVGNGSDLGLFEIAAPLQSATSLRFNGVGALTLSGTNSQTGSLSYAVLPAQATTGLLRESSLNFVGPGAVRAAGNNFVFDLGNATISGGLVRARVDLGTQSRALNLSLLSANAATSKIADSTITLDVTGSELVSTATSSSLIVSNGGPNVTTELRLPTVSTLRHSDLQIGTYGPEKNTAGNSSRVRIGTQANFNLQNLRVGEAGASARLDALAPGSTLRLRDGNGTAAMSYVMVGNFYNNLSTGADAVIDLSDGTIDAQISSLYVGNGAPTFPATARFRFGAGTLQVGNVTIGSGSSATPADFDYQIEQSAGSAFIGGALSYSGGNATGNVLSRYTLTGGHLHVKQMSALGNYTGTFRARLEWKGGTLHNYPTTNSTIQGAINNVNTPMEIILDGPDPKYLEVETARGLQIQAGCKLVGSSTSAILSKTGAGQLTLNCQSAGFGGGVELVAGQIVLGTGSLTGTLNAASFTWHSGTTLTHSFYSPGGVSRLALTGAFTKAGTGAGSSRILEFRLAGAGNYPLASYASTDLTLADFTATGIASNQAADFTAGSTALTVSIFNHTPFTTWRAAKLSSSTNLGSANDLADPDGDSRQNLLEYALGSEPLATDSAPPATIAVDTAADRLTLTFARIADPALTYSVRAAADPSGPWSGEGSETVFTSTGTDNVAGAVTASDSASLSAQPRRFLRLFVSR